MEPRASKKSEENERKLSEPHKSGMRPPMVEPTIVPRTTDDLVFMLKLLYPITMNTTAQYTVNKSLKLRLWLYFFMVVVELGLSIFHVFEDNVFILFPIVALALGILIGSLLSKAFHISWDHEAQEVITRWDTYGVIILLVSAVLEYFKETLVGYFIDGTPVVAISFALIAGIMFGRVLGMSGKVAKVIKENN
jgi:hypothetical protein